ncbi:MAG: omptin family outer membrane protease, partial [Treponema sp.]|nr:omptin family outer membrane protease [Treponema sp.]
MTSQKPAAILILTLLALFVLQPAGAKEKKVKKAKKPRKQNELHLYLEPQGCMVYGEQDEFVFWETSKNSNGGMVSKLEWQERDMKLYGGKVGFSFDRLGAEFQIHAAVKGESGEMYDSDWLNQDDVKTHYSINKNTLNSCFMLSFLTSFDFHPIRRYTNFSLAPTAEFA